MTRYCRNRETKNRIGERKKLEYKENKNNEKKRIIEGINKQNNNLNGDKDLIVLNQVKIVIIGLQCFLE